MQTPRPTHAAQRITWLSILISLALAVPLLWVAFAYGSKLGLAQGADSLSDTLTSFALLYSLWLAARPADESHPRGHHRAEPIAALFAAMMAGVLAVEVLREAITALRMGALPTMDWPVALVFSTKVAARLWLALAAGRAYRQTGSPAVRALQVDARNDVLVSTLALAGFFAARYGWAGWDPWLALPAAVWIGAAGLSLASENIRLLMGESAPGWRREELSALTLQMAGVLSVHQLTARHDGVHLEVTLHIVVDEALSLRRAHDIAEAVEHRLLEEQDVVAAMVHVDVDAPIFRPPSVA